MSTRLIARLHVFLPWLLVAVPAMAQSGRAASTVSGVVFDSVARAPLVNAMVQAVLIDSAATQSVFTAISDSVGRFVLSSLPRGKFGVGFQHDALTALGVETPIRAFEIVSDTSITLNLAVPSGRVIRVQRCGPRESGREGMLAGYIVDARRGALRTSAELSVSWTEMATTDGVLRTVPLAVRAQVTETGGYVACGLPTEEILTAHVSEGGYRTVSGDIVVPSDGVLRYDFSLADSGATKGTSRLSGRVVNADSTPLTAGRATISGLGVDVPVAAGQFTIAGVPAGTWLVDVRAIGYEPHSVLVTLAEGATTLLTIPLDRRAQKLDAVSVIGKPGRELEALNSIRDRMRVSGGTAFLPGNSWLVGATFPADVVRGARGFSYKSPTVVHGRQFMERGRQEPCSTMVAPFTISEPKKRVVIYLDGARYPGGLEMLNGHILMRQVLAIEAYPDVGSAPFLWRTNDACAVIAVWTKR